MTREEAKELLIHVLMTYEPRDQYGDLDDSEPYEEAMTMAIEALRNCSEIPNGSDIISRQAALEYFMTNTNWHDEDGDPIEDWDDKRKLLEDYFNGIPSAEPKTGEWIYAKEQLEIVPMWECSCCRIRIPKKFNFCPNCGTRMKPYKGGEDE